MKIITLTDPAQKEKTAREILEALQDWFEVPETREAYIRESRGQIFFAAEQDWTGYTKEQREEMTANKTAEIYKELKVKCGFRW